MARGSNHTAAAAAAAAASGREGGQGGFRQSLRGGGGGRGVGAGGGGGVGRLKNGSPATSIKGVAASKQQRSDPPRMPRGGADAYLADAFGLEEEGEGGGGGGRGAKGGGWGGVPYGESVGCTPLTC